MATVSSDRVNYESELAMALFGESVPEPKAGWQWKLLIKCLRQFMSEIRVVGEVLASAIGQKDWDLDGLSRLAREVVKALEETKVSALNDGNLADLQDRLSYVEGAARHMRRFLLYLLCGLPLDEGDWGKIDRAETETVKIALGLGVSDVKPEFHFLRTHPLVETAVAFLGAERQKARGEVPSLAELVDALGLAPDATLVDIVRAIQDLLKEQEQLRRTVDRLNAKLAARESLEPARVEELQPT